MILKPSFMICNYAAYAGTAGCLGSSPTKVTLGQDKFAYIINFCGFQISRALEVLVIYYGVYATYMFHVMRLMHKCWGKLYVANNTS